MAQAHVLGLPRIGAQRELKFAVEAFWRGEMDVAALQDVGRRIRAANRRAQRDAGLDWIVVGDFHWYDQVLSTLALVGALPARFGASPAALTLADYFAAARGTAAQGAMEMTKWFDTNYHYLVPEYSPQTRFGTGTEWFFEEVTEALAEGDNVKPVLLGPLSLLYLGKEKGGLADRLA